MKCYVSLLTAVLLTSSAFAQRPNLVPNPGFENLITTPCDPMVGEISQYIVGWQQGSRGTADILTKKASATCYANPVSTHSVRIGSEEPHGGESMGLIMTSVHNDYREYLGCNLSAPLIVGREYYCEVYVTLADYSGFATNNIGFLFRTGQYRIENGYQIFATPQVNCTTVVSGTDGWAKVSGTFVADQAYTHFLIGNFLPEEEITKHKNNNSGNNVKYAEHAAYYIDDVMVCRATDFEAKADTTVEIGTSAILTASGGTTYSWTDVKNPSVILGTGEVLRIKVGKNTTFRCTSGNEFVDIVVKVKETVLKYMTDLKGREVKKGRTIIVHSDEIEICVYDKYSVDGDSISLFYGDSLMCEHVALTHDRQSFKLKLDKETPKQIVLYAENLGSNPPNTAALAIKDGKETIDVLLTSDLQACDSFMLWYKPAD